MGSLSPAKLYLSFTCDTEDKYSDQPYMYECDFGDAGNCGVQYIMGQLEKYGMRGVFFTNIYEHMHFKGKYEGYIEKLIEEMARRGHEVGLHPHLHETYDQLPFYQKNIVYCNAAELEPILEYGCAFIQKFSGRRPASFRGGGYQCNEDLFPALAKSGFKVDSSVNFMNRERPDQGLRYFRSLNRAGKIGDILEMPIIMVINDAGELKKFDFNQLTLDELKAATLAMKERDGFSAAQLMFHSFSFMDQLGNAGGDPYFTCGVHKGYGVDQGLMRKFEAYLAWVAQDSEISVVTLEQLANLNLPLPAFSVDGLFYSKPELRSQIMRQMPLSAQAPRYNRINTEQISYRLAAIPKSLPRPPMYFPDNRALELANKLINGSLMVYRCIEPYEGFQPGRFDWTTRHSNIPDTFQLYLHCLNPLQYLLNAFSQSGDPQYIEFAWEIIQSWERYYRMPEAAANRWVANDHSTSMRALNLLFFARVCEEAGLFDLEMSQKLHDILKEHGEWLASSRNYIRNHNHGIIEDRSLTFLGAALGRKDWVLIAQERLKGQLEAAFSEEGISTENSPEYAADIPSILDQVASFLTANGDPFGETIRSKYAGTESFLKWAVKPNGIIAQRGDSKNFPGVKFGPEQKMQRPGSEKSIFFPKSGYYFYRSQHDQNQRDDTWKAFFSGYTNTAHKHADDGSFMLYAKGSEIFIDTGIYGYTNDAFREYFTSALAHNTMIADGASWKADRNNIGKTGISASGTENGADYVVSFNNAYPGIRLQREFVSIGDATILFDSFESEDEHTYSQLFHLGEDIKIISATPGSLLLKIPDTDCICRVAHYPQVMNCEIIRGDLEKPGYGLVSRTENHKDVTTTVKFNIKAKSGLLTTLITIEDDKGNVLAPDSANITAFSLNAGSVKIGGSLEIASHIGATTSLLPAAGQVMEAPKQPQTQPEPSPITGRTSLQADARDFCPVCNATSTFTTLHGRPRSQCAKCGSLERQRAFATLWRNTLSPIMSLKGKRLLLVSPARAETGFLKEQGAIVTSLDIRPEVRADILADICYMDVIEDGSFDFAYISFVFTVCHNYFLAFEELARVLTPNGCLFAYTPMVAGKKTQHHRPTTIASC